MVSTTPKGSARPCSDASSWESALGLEEGLAEKDMPVIHYQLACVEALAGNRERALDELTIAVKSAERLRAHAKADADLASIRDDPRFPT